VTGSDRKKVFRIGLTGGIAGGKTTVADLFADLGIPVIDTDLIARDLVRPGTPALNEIHDRFGDTVFDASGNLDRSSMRKIIFASDDARLDLEAILHPRIGAEVMRQADAANGPYQIIVVPLLVDSPLKQFVDRVLVVDCTEDVQMQRLIRRDAETEGQARRILEAQSSREDRLAIGNDVIQNNTDLQQLGEDVRDLDEMYRRLAGRPDPTARLPETP